MRSTLGRGTSNAPKVRPGYVCETHVESGRLLQDFLNQKRKTPASCERRLTKSHSTPRFGAFISARLLFPTRPELVCRQVHHKCPTTRWIEGGIVCLPPDGRSHFYNLMFRR